MTVKVIKQGKIPEDQPKHATCGHCNSELEYTDRDKKYSSDPRDCGDGSVWIECPFCKHSVDLAPKAKSYDYWRDR